MKKLNRILAMCLIMLLFSVIPAFADTQNTSQKSTNIICDLNSSYFTYLQQTIIKQYLDNNDFEDAKNFLLSIQQGTVNSEDNYSAVIGCNGNTLKVIFVLMDGQGAEYILNNDLMVQHNTLGHIDVEYIDEDTGKDIIPIKSFTTFLKTPNVERFMTSLKISSMSSMERFLIGGPVTEYVVSWPNIYISGYTVDVYKATCIDQYNKLSYNTIYNNVVGFWDQEAVGFGVQQVQVPIFWYNTTNNPVLLKLRYHKIK